MKGTSIIRGVMAFYRISADEFFGPGRSAYLSHARGIAIQQMAALGFSVTKTARIMKRNHATVIYWLSARRREKQKRYYAVYFSEKGYAPQPRMTVRPKRTTAAERALLLKLRSSGQRGRMIAMQERLGVAFDYTDKLAYTRQAGRLDKFGPVIPRPPQGCRPFGSEARA